MRPRAALAPGSRAHARACARPGSRAPPPWFRFVGGPNTRKDFHLEAGSEFFFQMRGNMQLPTVQRGAPKLVEIREGFCYLLPSRVPHSPQRPEADALGLVIERERQPHELDGLRWYTDDACRCLLYTSPSPRDRG